LGARTRDITQKLEPIVGYWRRRSDPFNRIQDPQSPAGCAAALQCICITISGTIMAIGNELHLREISGLMRLQRRGGCFRLMKSPTGVWMDA